MRTQSNPVIKLKNYKPTDFLIESVWLDISLDAQETIVRSKLSIKRRKGADAGTPLCLDGDDLTPASVSLNGKVLGKEDYQATRDQLIVANLPAQKTFELEVEVHLAPADNKKLMGLYQSSGVFCTQCEAEGFRRITYFLDRPDVLSIYTVRVEGDRKTCPVLLSNGNLREKGKAGKGRHFAIWHDPHPKPSYLFAVVGGDLDSISDHFKTRSGRKVDLNIYVEKGKAPFAAYAMDALKRSMTWDEEFYGCEYDLDVFNIVAVSDFNMGAMENKGLNIFNDKYVLADPDLATDADYANIEAIIAHEYFHNWTGNRVTCRDWFQLCLKEGLTVYRDQEFSADMRSASVERIQQVRSLKMRQFSEDAGPFAHPVRPAAYQEINNFYTATVYQKGAELVRMLATLVGPKKYRRATDLYFKRHDGEAAVVEDWLSAFEDSAKIDLSAFSRWYAQAGTPIVKIKEQYDRKKRRYRLALEQQTPPTPAQKTKRAVPIPLRFGLLSKSGQQIQPVCNHAKVKGDLIIMDSKSMTVTFDNIEEKPVLSILRHFSAPVTLDFKQSEAALLVRARHDEDLFNRWDAVQVLILKELKLAYRARKASKRHEISQVLVQLLAQMAADDNLDPAFRALAISLPTEQDMVREIAKSIDPDAISFAQNQLRKRIGQSIGSDGLSLIKKLRRMEKQSDELAAVGYRSLSNTLLPFLVSAKVDGALKSCERQFKSAKNMTDRMAALAVILNHHSDRKLVDQSLNSMYRKYSDVSLVLDKWFSLQASVSAPSSYATVKRLLRHEKFSLTNPNRFRALMGVFSASNLRGFHRKDGKSYRLFADEILKLDSLNPQVAARLVSAFNAWRTFEPVRSKLMRAELKRILAEPDLSRDTREIVSKALA